MRRMEPQRSAATFPSIPKALIIIAAKRFSPNMPGFNFFKTLAQEMDGSVFGGTITSIPLNKFSGVCTVQRWFSITAFLIPPFRVSAKYRSRAVFQMGLASACGSAAAISAVFSTLTMVRSPRIRVAVYKSLLSNHGQLEKYK